MLLISFDQLLVCPKVLVCGRGIFFFFFFCPLRLFPVFDRLASLDRPRLLRFPKKVIKKLFTHNLKTLSVYPAIQSMFCHHALSFPGSACYYAQVLGLLVRDFFSIFLFGFFSFPTHRPTDRQTQNQGTHSTVNKKSKWLKR